MDKDKLDEWEAEINSPAFRHGMDVGESTGAYEAWREANEIYELYGSRGLEAWLEFHNPKTMEEWEDFPDKNALEYAKRVLS